MYGRQENRRGIYDSLTLLLGIGIKTTLLAAVWIFYYNPLIQIPFWTKGNYFILALYFLILHFLTKEYGEQKAGCLKRSSIWVSGAVALILANAVFYLEICLLSYGFPTIWPLLAETLLAVFFEWCWNRGLEILDRRLFPPCQVLLIYGKGTGEEAVEKLGERKDCFQIGETADALEELKKLYEAIDRYEVLMLWNIEAERKSRILKYAYQRNRSIYVLPSVTDIILNGMEEMYFFDAPLFLKRNLALTLGQRFCKRLLDVVLAVLGIVLLSPLFLLVSVSIWLYDRGPVFYRQERCTVGNRVFCIYKFRSMVVDAEKDGVARLSARWDSRITPVGWFIRKTRLDELPQFFNVLKGDMSFVGPRPERPEIIAQYEKVFPEFAFRTKVKAGLTGYAQIYGKYNTTPYHKLKLDLFYIEHYSIWLDLKLLLQTVRIVLTKESTEGVGEEDRTALGKQEGED